MAGEETGAESAGEGRGESRGSSCHHRLSVLLTRLTYHVMSHRQGRIPTLLVDLEGREQ